MKRVTIFSVTLLLLTIVGCSGDGEVPGTPALQQGNQVTAACTMQTRLWGWWDVFIDIEERTVEAIPNRDAMFAANVVQFLNDNPAGLGFNVIDTTVGPDYVDVTIDVSITHPLPGMPQYNGYDVRGIFVADGSATMEYGNNLRYAVPGSDQFLFNADGYTRWWNPNEFPIPGLMGYTPGKFASPAYTGNARLNPYRYFASGLGPVGDVWEFLVAALNNGVFSSGSTNTRRYGLRFPNSKGIQYGYAVVANWEGEAAENHPSNAPEAVGCRVVDKSNVYYIDPVTNGGNLALDVSLFGWDDQPSRICIESSVLTGVHEFDPPAIAGGGGANYSTYSVDIPADNVQGLEGNEYWVIARYDDFGYTSEYTPPVPGAAPDAPLAAFFRYDLSVRDAVISVLTPNGGEEWAPWTSEEITWTSQNVPGTVFIEYSKDNFISDINTIATGEANDESYMWEDIPYDPSATVRVRVSSTDDPFVSDRSDADFTILQPTITVESPNGGEEWDPWSSQSILWDSEYLPDTVFIEYSKDGFNSDINTIATDEANDGAYTWDPIPNDPSTHVRVRISSTDYPDICDESDENFTIVGPSIDVVSPNGGETWDPGTLHEIAWTSQGITGTVFIEYSKDNFSSDVHTIGTDLTNDGYHFWAIPFDPSTTVRVRVSSTIDPDINDTSDTDFTISQPTISVTDPNGGEQWAPGSSHAITWTTQYLIGNVDIEYSKDNFVSDIHTIALDETNYWTYTWIVPCDISSTVRVRVRSVTYPSVSDTSDADFTITDSGWAATWGSAAIHEYGHGVAMHSDACPLLVGLVTSGDAFLRKFNACGTSQWYKVWGGPGSARAFDVAVDSLGNIYVVGMFWGTTDFNPDSPVFNLSSIGDYDAFLSKFNSSGVFQEAVSWGGNGLDEAWSVEIDGSDRVWIGGSFTGTVDFDPGGGVESRSSSAGSRDAYLSRFDSNCNFQWVGVWGGTLVDDVWGTDLDNSGNVYVSGQFRETVDFDPSGGEETRTSNGLTDCYLSKFNSSAAFQWVNAWGGTGWDRATAVAACGNGDTYVTGSFQGLVDFDPSPGGIDTRWANGETGVFLVRFYASGAYNWVRKWGGDDVDEGYGVTVDSSNDVYVTGYFEGTVNFGGGDVDGFGSYDVFLNKYNSSSTHQWVRVWGSNIQDEGYAVLYDATLGHIYTTGYFKSTVNFGTPYPPCNGSNDPRSSNGEQDIFLNCHRSNGCW